MQTTEKRPKKRNKRTPEALLFNSTGDALEWGAGAIRAAREAGWKNGGVKLTRTGRAAFWFLRGPVGTVEGVSVPAVRLNKWVLKGCPANE